MASPRPFFIHLSISPPPFEPLLNSPPAPPSPHVHVHLLDEPSFTRCSPRHRVIPFTKPASILRRTMCAAVWNRQLRGAWALQLRTPLGPTRKRSPQVPQRGEPRGRRSVRGVIDSPLGIPCVWGARAELAHAWSVSTKTERTHHAHRPVRVRRSTPRTGHSSPRRCGPGDLRVRVRPVCLANADRRHSCACHAPSTYHVSIR
jgi:hypothetical protein